ncbi:hypothetical protein MIZ01_0288 [Sideroxyarcus emersonii]|uniref:Lipoprotein LPP20-like domain-containing protein n=1 Tax=Sideroxyarcus emersonii TaxID=2764705 RepID=A0AAN2BXZ9_9PROT|nr:hypothetical protein MIZ01_0288 [Sideroxyarcus emersonii]
MRSRSSAALLKARMIVRKLLALLLVAVLLPGADAWGDAQPAGVTKARKAHKCTFPKSRRRAPDWVCSGQVEGLAMAAVGSAAKSRAGFSFMEKMAAADARAHLVQAVGEAVRHKLDEGAATANEQSGGRNGELITRIADATLQNTRIAKHSYGPNGALYVLVGLDAAESDRLIQSVTAEYLQQRK